MNLSTFPLSEMRNLRAFEHGLHGIRSLRLAALLAALGLLASTSAHAAAEVYKCKDEHGNPVFAQRPCSTDPAAVEIIDTSRSLKTGSGGPQAPVVDPCAAREQEIMAKYQSANDDLDKELADLGSNDATKTKGLSKRRADLRREEADELALARKECSTPAAAPPPVADDQTPAVAPETAAAISWHCIAENGVVFYRHDGCPISIRDRPANPQLIPEVKSQPLKEMSVRALQVPRSEACQQISSPDAAKRWGSNRDQKPLAGNSEC